MWPHLVHFVWVQIDMLNRSLTLPVELNAYKLLVLLVQIWLSELAMILCYYFLIFLYARLSRSIRPENTDFQKLQICFFCFYAMQPSSLVLINCWYKYNQSFQLFASAVNTMFEWIMKEITFQLLIWFENFLIMLIFA